MADRRTASPSNDDMKGRVVGVPRQRKSWN
jgi:hypothetical protein